MATASRNNLCPCGSGKTYKRCCGKKEAVSIESLIDREVAKCMQESSPSLDRQSDPNMEKGRFA
ncbi:hypothetical protein B1A75_12120 [Geobacillus sp. LEMMY01]|nr:hypothetical protein B1A75_12120 [Geobacillus sp. LEMMY01]